jgi:hypothetical protein
VFVLVALKHEPLHRVTGRDQVGAGGVMTHPTTPGVFDYTVLASFV